MGLGGVSVWSLLLILVIVLLIFGTKKLRNLGGDLGGAIRGFKEAMNEGEKDSSKKEAGSEQIEKREGEPQQSSAEDREREHKSS